MQNIYSVKIRLVSILVALAMLVTALAITPMNAHASDAVTGTMQIANRVGGSAVNLAQNDSGTGWDWNKDTDELTIDSSYTGEAIYVDCNDSGTINILISGDVTTGSIECMGSLNISSSSNGTITATKTGSDSLACIYSANAIEINGNVNLNATSNSSSGIESWNGNGIEIGGSANVTVNGWRVGLRSYSDINIGGNSQVTATATEEENGIALFANGSISISGDANVEAIGLDTGINCNNNDPEIVDNNITIDTTGTVIAEGSGYGIKTEDITIINGTVTATGTGTGSEGISSYGDTEFGGDANVIATGGCRGIEAWGDFNISGGADVVATALRIDYGAGICVYGGNITINTTGSVAAKGTNSGIFVVPSPSVDDENDYNIVITNGTVVATATGEGEGTHGSSFSQEGFFGICSYYDIEVNGSADVTATGFQYGIYSHEGDISISESSNVQATGNDGIYSYEGDISIATTGIVTAEGITNGIHAKGHKGWWDDNNVEKGNVAISNGTVTATGNAAGLRAAAGIVIDGDAIFIHQVIIQ
ncbi:MAG: hypothetical protein LBN34_00360 [Clostridiales Family XIII bacterium]|nr:hypothetical protein [Clostridiales Family XIII bacterium]